jgi:hypothetical protein
LDEVDHLHREDARAAAGHLALEKDDYAIVQAKKKKNQKALEGRITLAFYTCLKALSEQGPLVFMFDSYEEVTDAADRWIRANLLTWIGDGRLPRLITLTAGQGKPFWELSSGPRVPSSPLSARPTLANTSAQDPFQLTEYLCLFESRQQTTRAPGDGQTIDKSDSP